MDLHRFWDGVITSSQNLTRLRNDATALRNRQEFQREKRGEEKPKFTPPRKSDRALPAFAKPAAKQAGDERHEANCKEVHDCEVARDQERDQHGDGGRDARLQDRPSCRLESDDEAADGEGEEVEHRGEYDLPPPQLDILGAGDAFKLRSKKKPQDQAGDKVKHDHHDHADADPLPVQGSGHFLLLLVTLVGAATFSAAATASDLTHTRTRRWSRPQGRGPGSSLPAGISPA